MNNLPKVVAQQRRGRASNPRLLDRKSDALPLNHRAPLTSTRPHLRCDVGLEEGEYRENCLCLAVLCIVIMVHKGKSSKF